ncbi:hypothetical protein [Francisella philomiragia]|uniref:hypothetical protein n=1 Tax=Francisella philomiragia TaxID=28110 RepID=UPI001903BBB7|nr:hypothetical protein [Francisella philomiragia]MBK2278534.1 hypothetical protein [Francisella philomiragia]MBK2291089.1 hypothetical protein [Francisella philomiragia]
MKKILTFALIITLLGSCTLINDRNVTSSATPLVQRQQSSLLTNKTQGNKPFFDFIKYA